MLLAVLAVPSMVTTGSPTPTGVVSAESVRLREALDEAPDRGDDGIGRGRLGRRDAEPLRPEPAGLDIDDGCLDAAATDVHADGDPAVGHVGTVSSVIRSSSR